MKSLPTIFKLFYCNSLNLCCVFLQGLKDLDDKKSGKKKRKSTALDDDLDDGTGIRKRIKYQKKNKKFKKR